MIFLKVGTPFSRGVIESCSHLTGDFSLSPSHTSVVFLAHLNLLRCYCCPKYREGGNNTPALVMIFGWV